MGYQLQAMSFKLSSNAAGILQLRPVDYKAILA